MDFSQDHLAYPTPITNVIYTDFSKAFDSVPHHRLIHKLTWIGVFLTERYQRVMVNESVSSPTKVISGVPQGTILGPILFLLYINNMSDYIHTCKLKLFADDAKLYKTITSTNDNIQLQTDWMPSVHGLQTSCLNLILPNARSKEYTLYKITPTS